MPLISRLSKNIFRMISTGMDSRYDTGRPDVMAYHSHGSGIVRKPIGMSIYVGRIRSNLLQYSMDALSDNGRVVR